MADPNWFEIRNSQLFEHIENTRVFDLLKSTAVIRRLPRRTELFRAGERTRFLYLALENRIELVCVDQHRKATVAIVEPLTPAPLDAVILDKPSLVSGTTVEPGCLLSFPVEVFCAAVDQDKGLARAVMTQLAEAQRSSLEALKAEKLRKSMERLAAWIVESYERQGKTGTVEVPFSKRTLASQLGMAPENLSRNFSQLARVGVTTSGRRIYLTDPNALYGIAKANRSFGN